MTLRELERRLRTLMAHSLGGSWRGPVHPLEIARSLAQTLVAEARHGVAPNRYCVRLHVGEEAPLLELGEALQTQLYQYVMAEARSRDLTWSGPIVIGFAADAAVPSGEIAIDATIDAPAAASWKERTIVAPTLLVVDGFGQGNRHGVRLPTCMLGRGARCDIRIGDPKVSHQHALIRWEGHQFVVEDMRSANGTLLNGHAIGGASPLQGGDRLTLGYTTLCFEAGGESAARKKSSS